MTAEFKNGAYEPGVYVKGDVARRASTPSEAAKYVWDGFVRQADAAPAKESAKESEKAEEGEEGEKVEGESVEAPSDKLVAESAPEKRGPGRPRKPVEGDK